MIKRKKSAKIPFNMHRFNCNLKKFSGVTPPGTPSKDRPSAGRRALRARFVKT